MVEFVDFSLDRESADIKWHDAIEVPIINATLWDKCKLVLENCVSVPYQELQIPLILGYALCPSAMATRMPITFLYGQSRTGKSHTGLFCSKLYGQQTLQEGTTTASIRNELDNRKWLTNPNNPDVKLEKNTILVWDDLRPMRISPNSADSIFGLLKSGCSRQTSITKIAVPGGQCKEFCTFGKKIISSVSPIWSTLGAEELKGRSLVFSFKKNPEYNPLLNIEATNIEDLEMELKNYWFDASNRGTYVANKTSISRLKSKVDNDFKIMMNDVLATILTMSDIGRQELMDLFDSYQATVRLPLMEASITDELLDIFISEKKKEWNKDNEAFFKNDMPEFIKDRFEIPSKEVLDFLKQKVNDGSLEIPRLDNSQVHLLMARKNFKPLTKDKTLIWIENV